MVFVRLGRQKLMWCVLNEGLQRKNILQVVAKVCTSSLKPLRDGAPPYRICSAQSRRSHLTKLQVKKIMQFIKGWRPKI